jgi:hypothetical protein
MKTTEDISMTIAPGVVMPIKGPGLKGKKIRKLSKRLTRIIQSMNNGQASN